MAAAKKNVNLTAKWQLDAALLSRPVDLTALVSMARSHPDKFLDDNTLQRLVTLLLNEKNKSKSDKDTKLDVLNILANVAAGSKKAVAEVRVALGGVSEWFDDYIAGEEADPGDEPELHKGMVLLLARCWDYRLKTEDVLELCQGNRRIALCTVVGILEDGETYSTELKQRQRPGQGKMGQWEHELVCERYEKPLILQMCRLLRGFTHPGTYFEASTEELALYSVEKFADEMDTLLDITLRSRLVEKLAMALFDVLFEDFGPRGGGRRRGPRGSTGGGSGGAGEGKGDDGGDEEDDGDDMVLTESDHMAIVSVHAFLQNLYFYASENNEEFRRHMLVETLLIPRLVLPYLDRCVLHATILNSRAEAYSDMLEGDRIAEMALHNPQLVKGIAASLRTLIVASFRAPATQFVMALLKRLNPTAQILRARSFCRHHEYIFALLCLLNVNMGALDLSQRAEVPEPFQGLSPAALPHPPPPRSLPTTAWQVDEDTGDAYTLYEGHHAHTLLHELATVYASMDATIQARVQKRVMFSGALPISRDTPSYAAVMSILNGGEAGQLDYARRYRTSGGDGDGKEGDDEDDGGWDARAEAKSAVQSRLASVSSVAPQHGSAKDHPEEEEEDEEGHAQHRNADAKGGARRAGEDDKGRGHGHGGGMDAGSKGESDAAARYRLLGDLPTLGGGGRGAAGSHRDREAIDKDVKVALNLELPQAGFGKRLGANGGNQGSSSNQGGGGASSGARGHGADASSSASAGDDSIPTEFLCAINGHVMKAPVRARTSNLVFEKATIELWLSSRGSVCPLTGDPLTKEDLVPDDELRNKIKRYHIQQTSRRNAPQEEDDLYDF